MPDDQMPPLFFELFSGLPRQGPGDDASTRRALGLLPALTPTSRVLDIGCGTGAQTFALADATPAHIVAIDNHAPFVETLNARARACGLADRLEARVGDMRAIDAALAPVDLVWSEGAIYAMGFEAGLRAWRTLLAPGGHLVVSEACWMRPAVPAECAAFWDEEYPAIRDVPTQLARIPGCGYDIVGHFPLPASSWWGDYYAPLEQNVIAFSARHRDNAEALALAATVAREIDIWRRYSSYYSYEFFVLRAG